MSIDIYNSKAESETLESLRTAIERKALLYSLLYNNTIAIEQVIYYSPRFLVLSFPAPSHH